MDLCAALAQLCVKPNLTQIGALERSSSRPSHVEPTSMFGLFLRKVLLDCDDASFTRVSTLYDQMRAYVGRAPAVFPEHSSSMSSHHTLSSLAVRGVPTHAHTATMGSNLSSSGVMFAGPSGLSGHSGPLPLHLQTPSFVSMSRGDPRTVSRLRCVQRYDTFPHPFSINGLVAE